MTGPRPRPPEGVRKRNPHRRTCRAIGAATTGGLTIFLALTSGLTAAVWGVTIGWAAGAVSTTAIALRPIRRSDDRVLQAGATAPSALPGPSPD